MSPLHSRREFSDRLLKRMVAQGQRPVAGDFACVCTDIAADTWELFPIALVMTDGAVVSLKDERGALLAFDSVSERNEAVIVKATEFPDLDAVRVLCWQPFDGLAALRMRLARISGERG